MNNMTMKSKKSVFCPGALYKFFDENKIKVVVLLLLLGLQSAIYADNAVDREKDDSKKTNNVSQNPLKVKVQPPEGEMY